ncbi:ribonuclease H family protein [Schaalia georgiae]|uniref:ribonuclease H family protein n=1 Tax=Schaalia georgiae TaxID=52768 RepID=UPI0003F7806F|nr:ribonuclease H [Schaalia georgiae]
MTITVAVDGSSLGNPGPAGWAWVVDRDCWDAGGWPEGTNNIGELTALLEALEATAAAGLSDQGLHVLADSQYAINVASKWRIGWKKRGWTKADKKPIKNLALIQRIDRAMEGRTVTFEWVKGHAGHPLNELADDLARACAQTYQEGGTPAPGPGFRSRGEDEADGAQRPAGSAGSAGTPGGTDPDGTATGQEPPGSGPDGKEGGQEHPGSGTEPTDSGPADGAASSTAAEPRGGRGRRSARGERPFSPHPSVGGAPEPATAVGPEPTEAADPSPGEPVGPESAPSWPAGPGASAAGDPSALEPEPAPDPIDWEKRFLVAWTGGDDEALARITGPQTTRIWPGGQATTTLAGPVPPKASIGRFNVQRAGEAFLVRYTLRWEGGSSVESSVWLPGPVLVHHQSTERG